MPEFYPVYLNLKGKRCVVIGGGAIAEGKIVKLQDSGASIVVISPEVTPVIQERAASGAVEWQARKYQNGDLEGAFLGIAATDKHPVNREIFEEAEQLGVLFNAVDDPPRCTFIAPSVINRGPVTVAISTGGASPALARKLRETLEDSPALDWADMTDVISRARKQLKKEGVVLDPQRWQCCLTPSLLELGRSGREDEAFDQLMADLLGDSSTSLCPQREQCLPGGCSTGPLD